jgi:predicted nucleic acid-binding Zn ribbon protein
VYNNVGVVFKGSGFYKTDSRSTTPAKTESNPEVKTESKPASKPENKSKNKTD